MSDFPYSNFFWNNNCKEIVYLLLIYKMKIMKKLYLAFFALILSANLVNAQFAKNALGLRFGGGAGFGSEISYQRGLSDINRLELDLGWISGSHYNATSIAGIYQWVWEIDNGFNWFAGAGGRIGSWNWDHTYTGSDNGGVLLGIVGNVGIEYSFPVGIQLGLDYRPEIGLINHDNAFGNNIALSVRYRF